VICALCGGDPSALVRATWTIEVARDVPSQNVLASNKGASRWRYAKERDEWVRLLGLHRFILLIPKASILRRVTFLRTYSGRQKLRDRGNLIGGLKPVLDAMTLTGLIVDDSPKWCEDYYFQARVEKGGALTIKIEELA
jgi:hypothetical protein